MVVPTWWRWAASCSEIPTGRSTPRAPSGTTSPGPSNTCEQSRRSNRLLKKTQLRRPTFGGYPRARAALRRTDEVRLAPAPILRMGTRRAALHLDLFEQPGRRRLFKHPVSSWVWPSVSGRPSGLEYVGEPLTQYISLDYSRTCDS